MILGSQFNSFIHPISILMALPFSITGAILALWIFDQSLNLYSMIGVLLLMGIAKKNSILLVEFTNHVREGKGHDEIKTAPVGQSPADKPSGDYATAHGSAKDQQLTVREAQLLACPVRLRPILMTSAATVVAALPLAIDQSPGHETRVPMALAIIGGNIVSTVFTLYVVPCVYNLLTRLERHDDSEASLLGSERTAIHGQ
jgi:multidrug efflux pump subunit AcrB